MIYFGINKCKELIKLHILELNWNEIRKRVIIPLWNRKFKSMYENAKMDYDDFESLAAVELTWAIKNGMFNPQKSNLFTYATNVINKKAMTELRNCTQRDKRKILYVSDSVDAMDKSIVEKISCKDNKNDVLSEKMMQYLNKLSNLQKRILFLMSDGYNNNEIINALNISQKDLSDALGGIRAYRNVSLLY